MVLLVPLLLLPLIETQVAVLVKAVPSYIDWMTQSLLPGMQTRLGVDPASFDVEKVKAALLVDSLEPDGSNRARLATQALDVDGHVLVEGAKADQGTLLEVEITRASTYDLVARPVEP